MKSPMRVSIRTAATYKIEVSELDSGDLHLIYFPTWEGRTKRSPGYSAGVVKIEGFADMPTTLSDLINSIAPEDILRECAIVDPHNAELYPSVLFDIKQIAPVRGTKEIVIRKVEDDWIDVSGREFGDAKFWAIEFMDWAEWMGCTYVTEGVELTDAQIVAECLNEMTWAGWSVKEASEASESLTSSLDEAIDEMMDEIDLHKKRSE